MKTIRRHWGISLTVAVFVIGIGVFALRASGATASFFSMLMMQGEPEYTVLSRGQQSGVRNLLNEISLDRDALVALNLSSQQAESVLSDVRSWYVTNENTLATLQDTIHEKVHAVRVIEKAIRMGPLDENHQTQLTTARADLATARAAYQTALTPAKAAVALELSGSQNTTWTAIQGGWGQQMPIRMISLTDGQRMAISDAWHRFRRQRAAAGNKEALDAAATAWKTAQDTILDDGQEAVRDGYYSNYASASGVVADAIALVFPTEEEEG